MTLRTGVNRKDLHAHNVAAVLNCLQQEGPIARYQLAKKTGLTRATISAICTKLLDKGLIVEVGWGAKSHGSRGGPRPILLDLNADARLALGIQFSKKGIKVGLVNLKGQVVDKREISFSPKADQPAEATVEMACQMVAPYLRGNSAPRAKILGVGVGAPGVVDSNSGITLSDPYLGWEDVPLKSFIEAHLGLQTFVDHNVRAMALAELRFGLGPKLGSFLEVYWSTGVGSGMAVRGRLYTGSTYGDGQLGHVVINPEGPQCVCGNRGCLETFVGEQTLVSKMRSLDPTQPWEIDTFINAARAGHPQAVQVLQDAARLVAIACANLINVLGPQAVVIGGDVARAGELILEPIRETLSWRVHPRIRELVQVHTTALGTDLGLVGAASLALENLFYQPEGVQNNLRS